MNGHRSFAGQIAVLFALIVLGQGILGVASAAAATTLNVSTTADVAANAGACGSSSDTTVPSPLSLREATCLANNIGGAVTINLPAGTYKLDNGEIQPGLNSGQTVNLIGAGTANTIIDAQHLSRVVEYDKNLVGNVHGTVSGLTITNGEADASYGGAGLIGGSYTASVADSLSITSVDFSNNVANKGQPRVTTAYGGGLSYAGGNLTLSHVSFENNTGYSSYGSAMWYSPYGATTGQTLTMSDVTFTGNYGVDDNTNNPNTYPATGGALDLGVTASAPGPISHTATYNVSDSRFVNNTFTSTNVLGAVGGAIRVESDTLNLTGSTFSGNSVAAKGTGSGVISGGAIYSLSAAAATLRDNRFVGNTAPDASVVAKSGSSIDAQDNWWGCNAGPGQSGCDTAGSGVTASPWLTFSAAGANPAAIPAHGTSTLSAGFTKDSSGTTISSPDFGGWNLVPVSWGSAAPSDASVTSSSTVGANGLATATFTAGATTGTGSATATADGTSATQTVVIAVPPSITANPADTSASPGTMATFSAAATGTPSPTVQWQRNTGSGFANIPGATSTTYSFTASQSDNGNQYRAVFTNAGGSATTTAATLTVGTPPAFTSASAATFSVGQDGSFSITASGNPAPTITAPNALPSWLSFTGGSNGQGTLSGHPPAGSGGTYSIPLHAANGVAPAADQTLTLTVDEAPAVTVNPSDDNVTAGAAATFTASASGYPVPTVQWQQDTGSGFTNIPGATSTTYAFPASQSDSGSRYRAVFSNGIGSSATTTAATLTVGTPPVFTTTNTTTFTAGQSGSFTVAASGPPAPTITTSTSLPAWLTLGTSSGGQATLSGTPPATSGGTYTIALHADNGYAPAADQTLTLTVDEAPAITTQPSDSQLHPGDTATFTAAASGYPAPTVQWQRDTGSGFADIGGATSTSYSFTASQSDTGNQYRAVFSNGVGSPATTRAATLSVGSPPAFTSASATTFTAGQQGSFTVAASGPPAPSITTSTSLPSWLTLGSSSGGQAMLSGTPPAGSGGIYTIALHADNSYAPAADQTLTLTVDEKPVIATQPSDQTVQPGDPVTFTAAASGYPAPTVQWQRDTGSGFADISGATSTSYGFTAAASDRGNQYRAVFTNAAGSTDSNAATLTVQKAPAFTSAAAATFVVGQDGSATVQTSGLPAATVSATSALPGWLTLSTSGAGSATLAGRPPVGTGGTYTIDLKADNGVDPAATQRFTLTVDEPAAVTSADHVTFTTGASGTFTVTSRGYPTPAITETGALPSGLTLTDNADGTATLFGTPADGTAGNHTVTVHADSPSGSGSQTLTITVLKRAQAITVTSPAPDPAVAGGSETLSARADSGLPVNTTVDASSSGCSLSGSALHFDHSGTCLIDYDQPGNGTWAAAPRVQQRIAIVAHASSVQVVSSPNPSVFGQPVTATARVISGGAPGSGSVRFAVDGASLGAPVPLVRGQATSTALADAGGQPPSPGAHTVTATYVPSDPTTDAPAGASGTEVVGPAASSLALTVGLHSLSATAAALAPGAGMPGGAVSFSVGGRPVGTAELHGGVATLAYTVPSGATRAVAATYAGDAHFTGAAASVARTDPSLTATVIGVRRSRSGWYRAPVTVRFTCAAHGGSLTGGCPSAVVLSRDGAGQSVTRSVLATDGGAASVSVRGINIDHRAPVVSAAGVRDGARYATPPTVRCVAHDAVSGVARCRIRTRRRGDTVSYRLTATDVAGNTAVVTGRYRLLPVRIAGQRPVNGPT